MCYYVSVMVAVVSSFTVVEGPTNFIEPLKDYCWGHTIVVAFRYLVSSHFCSDGTVKVTRHTTLLYRTVRGVLQTTV